jgi:hypothetical protein
MCPPRRYDADTGGPVRSLPIAALTFLAGLAVTVGCSGPSEHRDHETDDPRPDASPSVEETPTPSTDPSPPPDQAKQVLRRAVRNLGDANTGHLTVVIPLTDDVVTVEEGDYQIEPLRAEVTRIMTNADQRLVFRYLTFDKNTWIRVDSVSGDADGAWGCWVDVRDLARLTPGSNGTPVAVPGQLPGTLQVASFGKGHRFIGGGTNEVEGTTDLYSLVALVGGSELVAAGGLDPRDAMTTPARFQVNGEMLIGFEVDLATVPREVSDAVADNPSPWLALLPESEGEMVAYFAKIGQPVEIVAPKPREIVEFTDASDFESALQACGRGADPT